METFVKSFLVVFGVLGITMMFIGGGMVINGAPGGEVIFAVGLLGLLLSLLIGSLADELY